MKKNFLFYIFVVFASMAARTVYAQHPSIMLTKKNVPAVREGIKKYPLLKSSWETLKADADKALNLPVNVPTPADGGGGITHEQHKQNYKNAVACGVAYQLTGDKKYAEHVKNLLLDYASKYNTWGRHPKRKQQPGGKIFWQNLNDCVWLVYMIQGYDCVYDYISKEDRKKIEDDLFTMAVKEQTEVNKNIFNLIHNHATWSTAGVGMTGYVLGRKDWVEMALKGSAKDGKTGFLRQMEELFSPDGYYAEGPYYLRYAIQPFMIFARAIQQYQPELKIYEFRNSLLKKAVDVDLQMTYNKVFFPVNDALKDKTFESEELVYAVNIAYSDIAPSKELLDIAQQQKRVIVSDGGMKVAKAIAEEKSIPPFSYKPMWIRDGADGKGGGLGVLRKGKTAAVIKAATQGMGHGHFDRLNILFFDNNVEVLSDYGSVRFLNVETKTGGGYTKENDTWSKQSVAHNTVVVDKRSHFKGDVDEAEKHHPELLQFDASQENMQIVSARETKAYEGVEMVRTLILFSPEKAEGPILIDVFNVKSEKEHQYDMPFWYQGHITNTPFSIKTNNDKLSTLGSKEGYQHLWHTATGKTKGNFGQVTVLNNRKFYTTTFLADSSTQVQFVLLGANDPQMNLRNEKAFIVSQPKASNHTFINIVEPHGANNPIAEFTVGAVPVIKDLKLLSSEGAVTKFEFTYHTKVYAVTLDHNNKQQFITIK